MPWRPLPRIAFAVATYPFQPSSPADLPLELGDELYIIERGGRDGSWYRGYLVAPPSLLAGLTSVKGQSLEARVFSGIFPRSCVEVREVLGDVDNQGQISTGITNGDHSVPENGTRPESQTRKHDRDGNGFDSPESVVKKSKTRHSGRESDATSARRASQNKERVHDEDDGRIRRSDVSSSISHSHLSSLPVTPVSLNPKDPSAPKPAAPVPMLKIGDETPTSSSEPLVDEIASCLREWHSTNIHQLLLARQYGTLEKMSNLVSQLDLARRQLLHDVLTAQERAVLREETVWNLVRGNKMLSAEVIVRDPSQRGRLLTGDDSAIELTKLQSVMSCLDSNPEAHLESMTLHHLLFELKAVAGHSAGPTTLTISLCLKGEDGTFSPLSETFALDVPSYDSFSGLARSSNLKTLFTDLSGSDIGERTQISNGQVILVVRVQANQVAKPTIIAPKGRSSTSKDGALTNKSANALNSSKQGSLKGGRRSLMFGSKPKGALNHERTKPTAEAGRATAHSSHSEIVDSNPSKLNENTASEKEVHVVRTVGVGLLDVGQILKQDKDVEQVIHIWSPAHTEDEEDEEANANSDAIKGFLSSSSGRYKRSQQAARVHVHLYPFAEQDADVLVRKNPTSMHQVTQTKKIGFSEAPTKPRSDIYLTLSEAIVPHEALLSHPVNGHVQIARSFALQNLQLTLEVRDGAGKRVEHSIYPSSNSAGHTAWRTTVAQRGSQWNQTICLKIPADRVPGSHLIMSVADAPEFPFALCWMPLWDQQAFIRDGPHTLVLHAYDKSTSSIQNGKGAYLSLPWNAAGKDGAVKDEGVTGAVATLVLESYLCSTEYSQDQVILGLINWRDRPASNVLEVLRRIVFVPEIEIVKQLSAVLDALFNILVEKAGKSEIEDLVFNDLVTVLGIVHDRRFNLGPIVDQYTEEQFSYPFATPCLIRSYTRLLQATSDPQQARNLRATFKVGRQVLKFIIHGRGQQRSKEEGIGTNLQSSFHRDMHDIFESLESLMRNQSPILVGSKTLVVQHFHTWLPELLTAFSKEEVLQIAVDFMDSCEEVKGKLILYKLILLLHYIQLDQLFSARKERRQLVISCNRWLAPYWGETNQVSEQWRDQIRLCSSVVAEFMKSPIPELYQFMPKIVTSYCTLVTMPSEEKHYLSLLFSKTFPFQTKQSSSRQYFDEALAELAALMATISSMPEPQPLSIRQAELSEYIFAALDAQKSVISYDAYPASWLSLHIYHHRSTMKSLEYLSSLLGRSFLPSADEADKFDMELWKAFFMTLLKLVSSDVLALETFPEQKRRVVWKIAGDVREHGADLLRRGWESIGWETSVDDQRRYGLKKLGGYQVQYVPSLVSPIIELCLSVHEGLRRVAIEILQTMIVSEWALSEDLGLIEAEMIGALDAAFKRKQLNESATQKLFIGELLDLFEPISQFPDDALWGALKELVTTIDELMDLLMAAHDGSISETLHTLRLMEFMKDLQKEDIFIRYVHEMARGQINSRNPTEAGLALQCHADLYRWDPNKIVPALIGPTYPEQSAFERKEALYFEIIQQFEDGKAWAHALACYRELADHYEHTIYDFSKLARTQKSMAKINEAIVKDERHPTRYFRVIYKGLGFATSLRDKQYIFEGLPLERMAAFTDRMQKQHPQAQIVQSGEIEDLEGQFLQISSVSPHRELDHPVYQRARVPQSVRENLLMSNPARFSVTTKRHTAGSSVKEHWVEKRLFTTAEEFPTILRRTEVIAAETIKLSPIQTAIERTWRKTSELYALEKRAVSGDDSNYQALTETLNILLELESTNATCLALYRQLLPGNVEMKDNEVNDDGNETDESHEKDSRDPLESALGVALTDHALAISRCLSHYSRPSLQATRSDLHERFENAFGTEIAFLTPPATAHRQVPSQSSSAPRISIDPAYGEAGMDSARAGSPVMTEQRQSHQFRPSHEQGKFNRLSLNFLKRSSAIHDSRVLNSKNTSIQPNKDLVLPSPEVKVNGTQPSPRDKDIAITSPTSGASTDLKSKSAKLDSAGMGPISAISHSRYSKEDGSRPKHESVQRHSFMGNSNNGGIETPTRPGSVEPSLDGIDTAGGLRGGDGGPGSVVSVLTEDENQRRPVTADTMTSSSAGGGRVGGIKKRFSLLRIGRKKSGASVRVGEVVVE